jgi:protein-S-isoprenylcysteine O-methyltransferase Ste14
MLYSIFVSIKTNGIGIWIGSSIFAISVVLFGIALINYATTNPNMPVTKGIYKLTRNPQQVFAGLMWIGAGIAMQSYIIIISFSIQFVLLYPSLLAQEKFCINKYGYQYKHYMQNTPRYLFI